MLADLLDLVLPVSCAGCRSPGSPWCVACDAEAAPHPGPTRPTPCPPGFPLTVAAAAYDGVVREALLAHQEHGRRAARPALSALLAAAVDQLEPHGAVLLVPVPSSAAAVRARGGDPLQALAVATARRLGRRATVMRALRQVRTPDDQAGLDADARIANLHGALVARPLPRHGVPTGASLVVIDDVCTTGATLTEAARALCALDLVEPRAAVVAATQRRFPPTSAA